METKVCEFSECGKEYSRTVSSSGKLQPRPTWEKRRFCTAQCANRYRKFVRTDEVVTEVEHIIGTDHPESIAKRIGFETTIGLITSLRTHNRPDLADRLSREWSRFKAPFEDPELEFA